MIVRRLRPMLLVAATAAVLGGCGWGTGLNAETAREQPATPGINVSAGPIELHDLMVVPAVGPTTPGPDGYLLGTMTNTGGATAELVGVTSAAGSISVATTASGTPVAPPPTATPSSPAATSPRAARRSPSPPPSPTPPASALPVRVAAGGLVQFGAPGSGLTGPSILIQGAALVATPGTTIGVTFTFGDGTAVTAQVPVNPDPGTTATATPVPTESTPPSPQPTPFLLSPSSEIQPTTAPPTP